MRIVWRNCESRHDSDCFKSLKSWDEIRSPTYNGYFWYLIIDVQRRLVKVLLRFCHNNSRIYTRSSRVWLSTTSLHLYSTLRQQLSHTYPTWRPSRSGGYALPYLIVAQPSYHWILLDAPFSNSRCNEPCANSQSCESGLQVRLPAVQSLLD